MRRSRPARDLRTAIDCLPLKTRKAMLGGVESNRIIVGAYTDRSGGACPRLPAPRHGGTTTPAGPRHGRAAPHGPTHKPRELRARMGALPRRPRPQAAPGHRARTEPAHDHAR